MRKKHLVLVIATFDATQRQTHGAQLLLSTVARKLNS